MSTLPLNPPVQACRRAERSRAHAGFSLLEAVVAMAIMGFITLASYYAFEGIVKMKETLESTSESFATARVALARISRELEMSYLTQNPNKNPEPRFVTVFRGINEEPVDTLHFSTFSHQRLYRESLEADTTEITYTLAPDEEAQGLSVLLHREASRIDGDPENGGIVEILARRVASFQLRYFDPQKQEWEEEWDTEKIEHLQQLPRAVEIVLVVVDLEGGEHRYSTIVLLPMTFTKGALG